MSLSGRHQTLLSIYGAVNEGKKKQLKKPQRPTSGRAIPRRSSSASQRPTPHVRRDKEESEKREEQAAEVYAEPAIDVCGTSVEEKKTVDVSKSATSCNQGRKLSPTGKLGAIASTAIDTTTTTENTVISLYGDGFIEIPLSDSLKTPEGVDSPRQLGNNGFSISMLLFKAADTEKHKGHVFSDSGGPRHKAPELDDTGEFVRWLCCGSTNRNIFGCSASRDEESLAARSRGLSDTTPKLLAAKFRTDDSEDEDTTFSIYDRGVLGTHRDKGEDGGCRVRWRGWEAYTNNYEVPCNRWTNLKVVFDCRYLQVFFDDVLIECARIQQIEVFGAPSRGYVRGRRVDSSSVWAQAISSSNSVYVGGHPSYAKSVRDWRSRIGFVGLIASFNLCKLSSDQLRLGRKSNNVQGESLISLAIPNVGSVRDISSFENIVNAHRNVFWRQNVPPIWKPIAETSTSFCGTSTPTKRSIVLLANFYDGAHCDVGVASPKSFENLLLTAVQSGDICVQIEYAAEFRVQRTHDHVCRSQVEYEQKSSALIASIEQMSPLLNVVANPEGARLPSGYFEITMELTRAAGRNSVVVVLHSMNTTGCFPNLEDVKRKINSIVLFEAKRSPGEEIQIQAFRHLLALAGLTRHNRERTFMESVINRKLVLTERKVAAEFEKIGFCFASTELQDVVSYLKRIQDNYARTHNHRMNDLPSLSMLLPTPSGLYTLPFMNTLLVSSTMTCESGEPRSPWRFVCVLVDHDFQLVDFVHDGCPVTKRGGISYRQGQSINNSFVDRVYLRLTSLSNKVFCVLLSLQKITEDENSDFVDENFTKTSQFLSGVRIQLENVEERHILGMFDAKIIAGCRWYTLAAVYRSKKNSHWQLQAIGGSGRANSIYASIDEINVLLAELRIIQTYEIRVHYIPTGDENDTIENSACEEFAHRLAKNIRFGRNGRIVLVPMVENGDKGNKVRLRIALKLQEVDSEIDVYTHRTNANRTLPTIQSVYRTLLRILDHHGIKECLQQNPFAPQNKRVKRHVEYRVVSAQTNAPVDKVHVFIEKNINFDTNLAKTVLPTLMMGSRLVSIRRRLQKKRTIEITQEVASAFVTDIVTAALKRAKAAASLNVTLISVIRARALLRRVMRLRYEKIKGCIMERVRKSEHTREYSQSVPIRFQRLFANRLVLTESERELLQHSTREELTELDSMLRGVSVSLKEKPIMDERALLEEWKSEETQFALDERAEDNSKTNRGSDKETTPEGHDLKLSGHNSGEGIKDRRRLFVTDSEGRAHCRLIPGSYSLYIFHLDYFEWTSLVAVYPTMSASGLYSGPTTSSSVQEMVIPLDEYRWTYALQLVDYYHPHVNVKFAGIPLQIINSCSSERQVVTTDSDGCATWDVCKGLYAVDVLRECTCVQYSALKQVVVDGGRYRTSRIITMPVLFGGVRVTVLVVMATCVTEEPQRSNLTNVHFHSINPVENIENEAVGKRRNARIPFIGRCDLMAKEEQIDGDVMVGSMRAFTLKFGTYRLEVTNEPECFPVSLPVNITWASSRMQAKNGNQYIAVLSPKITVERTFRVVLSYVGGVESMDLILEVWKGKTMIGHVWRQNSEGYVGHVKLETINSVEGCEYQSLFLQCQEGFTYRCLVVSNLSMTHCLRPQTQIYSSAGLIYQCSQPPSIGELYWHVCSWNASGVLVPTKIRATSFN